MKPERLGQELTLRVADEVRRFAVGTTTGRVTLHGLPPGRQEARLELAEGATWGRSEFWLARVDRGWPLWNLRRVRSLQAEQELRVAPLPAGPGQIRVTVYGASDLARLRWTFEPPPSADPV